MARANSPFRATIWALAALLLLAIVTPGSAMSATEDQLLRQLATDFPMLQGLGWSTVDATGQCGLTSSGVVRIGCNNNVVISIDLSGLGLTGTIPEYVAQFPWLQQLKLTGNNMNGTIPANLGDVGLRGAAVNQMGYIYLDDNDFEGTIPESFNNFAYLKIFEVQNNPRLIGPIPNMTALTSLLRFVAFGTNLNGTIPESASPRTWNYIDVSDTLVEGTIPQSIGLHPNLVTLRISRSKISGSIPDSIGSLTKLKNFFADQTSLNGSIPNTIVGCTDLQYFSAHTTQLTGPFPTLGSMPNLLFIELGSNQLEGTLPEVGGLTNLQTLHLRNNRFIGELPASLYTLTKLKWLDLTDNQFNGTIPVEINNLRSLVALSFGNNSMSGPLPPLVNLTALTELWLYSNQFNGSVPSLNRLGALQILHLAHNRFSGTVPPLSVLSGLTTALLDDNLFTGCFPIVNAPVCNASANAVCSCIEESCGVPMCPPPVAAPMAPPMVAPPVSEPPVDSPSNTTGGGVIAAPVTTSDASAGSVVGIAAGVGAAGAVAVIAAIAIIIVVVMRKKKNKNNGPTNEVDLEAQTRIYGAIEAASKDLKQEWMIPFEAISFGSRLGEGAFGIVYKGRWKSTEVAIKQANISVVDEKAMKAFNDEAILMLSLRPHPNIVQVLGVSSKGTNFYLVMQFCAKGSLDGMFGKRMLNLQQKLSIMKGIAAGLHHLHDSNIVHRDLAARNVLLSEGMEPKITDFGLSRMVEETQKTGTTASLIGPIKWMSPEALGEKVYSPASDVWSLGCVFYEIMAETEPYPGLDILAVGTGVRDGQLRLQMPEGTPDWLVNVCEHCWQYDAKSRPSIEQICEVFIQHVQ